MPDLSTAIQSDWFKVAATVAGIALLYLLYLRRVAQISASFRSELKARQLERERIARALHDTLLQGVQSLTLRLQTTINTLPPTDPIRLAIEPILDSADQMVIAGRDQVMDLRTSMGFGSELSDMLESVTLSMGEEYGIKARFSVEGSRLPMQPLVSDDIYCVGREALSNAFRHGVARLVEVTLVYGHETFRMHVRDDGQGIAGDSLGPSGRRGHWGLTGMRERAASVGGQLDIWTGAGKGTEVVLTVPAGLVYTGAAGRSGSRWRWLIR